MKLYEKPLFIFEMANNHQGSVEHGLRIIQELKKICIPYEDLFHFAIKFQYRNLDTFIRPDYKNREDIKNVKRFEDTKLTLEQFQRLLNEVKSQGFYSICTPFDESSVESIIEQKYDVLKVASCSFTDWPLLEKIAKAKMPVIASAAGSSMEEIRKVISFFNHRSINISLMHCVAEYPTLLSHLQMNQIDLFRKEFPDTIVGFSTHEQPENDLPIRLAIAKGAQIFEKHIGISTETISLNGYSATPSQAGIWLQAAKETYEICGIKENRYESTEKEKMDLLGLQRGVFANKELSRGKNISQDDVYFAFPCENGQLLSKDFSKYNSILLNENGLKTNRPIMKEMVQISNKRELIQKAVNKVILEIKKSNIVIPINSECSLSHHYGIEKYEQWGVAIIDCINREYCKKILVLLPGQDHPAHFHKKKEETFSVVYGELKVNLQGIEKVVRSGESMVVERGVKHSFSSEKGCVFEEISTTHFKEDSFYEKQEEFVNPRKTDVFITKEMIENLIY